MLLSRDAGLIVLANTNTQLVAITKKVADQRWGAVCKLHFSSEVHATLATVLIYFTWRFANFVFSREMLLSAAKWGCQLSKPNLLTTANGWKRLCQELLRLEWSEASSCDNHLEANKNIFRSLAALVSNSSESRAKQAQNVSAGHPQLQQYAVRNAINVDLDGN